MTLPVRSRTDPRRLFPVALAATAGSIAILLIAPSTRADLLWLRWAAIMTLAWWLPGILLVAQLRLRTLDLPAAIALAAALGLGWMVLLALAIHWLPGPIAQWHLIAAFSAGALALIAALRWRPPLPLPRTSRRTWAWMLAILLLGGLLRLPGLGYHEFHFDEVVLLDRATEAIGGDDVALARHTKGPGEIAVETVLYRTLGTATESTARLPFALTGIFSVLALAVAGRALFSTMVGVWAALLFLINGYSVALSRIAQYQPAVLLFSILAIYAAWTFSREHHGRWLALALVFAVGGTLMHYELALTWPAVVLAAWFGWRRTPRKMPVAMIAFSAVTISALVVTATYLQLFLNPYFDTTESYLGSRLGAVGETFNLPYFVEISTFYNSTWFLVGLLLLTLVGVAVGWRRSATATSVLIFWFLPYLVVYFFIIQFPGTHFYLLMPSWSILAALPLAVLSATPLRRPILQPALWVILLLWLASSTFYIYLVFFRQAPEYVVRYQSERLPFFWAPYGEKIPAKPRFGFPLYEGWQTLGVLAEWHYLSGTYASNEYSRHLRWYLGGLDRVDFAALPDYIFVARDLQEADPTFTDDVLDGYQRIGEVRVRDEPRIAIWANAMAPGGYMTFDAEPFAPIFPGLVPALERWPDPPPRVRDVPIDAHLTLVAGGADPLDVVAGDSLLVHTEWLAEQPLGHDYKLFVHLAGADGRPVAQWDGMPRMNTSATSQWPLGETVTDRTLVPIPENTPPGAYSLLVGLYDPQTGERVGRGAVEVATITVR